MRTPNGQGEIGDNRDRFIPFPASKSPFHQQLYEFVGKWMGLALRTKNLISLNFPALVWKQLTNDPVTESDVTAIDSLSFQLLDTIRQLENTNPPPDLFDRKMAEIKFTAYGSDKKMRPLCEGGDNMTLTWANRHQFIALFKKFRLNEFSVQCAAIKRGLATVVPVSLLSLFSWKELEAQVCGRGITIEQVDLLEKMTSYSGCSASDAHIRLFWEMYRNRFTDEQRALWLVFVWGRSRLPLTEADFERKFTISSHSRSSANQDTLFPIGHTCGFSVEMPKYSNTESMYGKITWAINYSNEIDADGGSANMSNTLSFADDDDGEPSLF